MRFDDWLDRVGLRTNPFAATDEETHPTDERWVVDHPHLLDYLISRGSELTHHMVVAEKGGGKTMLRKQLLRHYLNQKAVVVELIEWDSIEKQHNVSGSPVIDLILQDILQQIEAQIDKNMISFKERAFNIRYLQEIVSRCVDIEQNCFVVIDRVEEDTNNSINLLTPLLYYERIHKISGLAFKYIVFDETFAKLKNLSSRIKHLSYFWNDEDLYSLIRNRLQATNPMLIGLWSLAEPNLDNLDSIIVNSAEPHTPEQVLDMCNRLIRITARSVDPNNDQLSSLNIQVDHVHELLSSLKEPVKPTQNDRSSAVSSEDSVPEISSKLEPDDIQNLRKRLSIHRANLALLLEQEALHGKAYVPQAIIHGIAEARREIRRLKWELRRLRVPIEDHPDDEPRF